MFGRPKSGGAFGGAFEKGSATRQPDAPPPPTPEKVAEVKKSMEQLLAERKSFYAAFAEDTSLQFIASNAFMIELDKGVVHQDAGWFAEQGYTETQIVWANLHELSHFRDLAADPKRMLDNFDYIKRRGQKAGIDITARMREEGVEASPTAAAAMGQRIYHTLYNVFDDIYVNNSVSERAPAYEPDQPAGKEIRQLYRTKLFPGTDYREYPRHLQFVYALLRTEMLPDERLKLSPEVQSLIDKTRIKHANKQYSVSQFIEAYLKPQSKADTRAGERYSLLKKYIEPLFDDLLAKDLRDWKPKKKEPRPPGDEKSGTTEGQGGDAGGGLPEDISPDQPFKKEYDEFDKRHVDQIKEEDIERFTKKKAEAADAAVPDEEKQAAEKAQAKLDEEWRKGHGISAHDFERFKKVEREIEPYLDQLAELWRHIVYGTGSEFTRKMKSGFRKGSDIDIDRAVRNWPEIQGGQADDVKIMRRMSSESVEVKRPESIRVRLLVDDSVSMQSDNKLAVQDRAIALVLSSLSEFNTYLNRTRAVTGSKLTVDTQVISFGSSAKELKPLMRGDTKRDERAEMMGILGKVHGVGSTNDAAALKAVRDSLGQEGLAAVKNGSVLELVFVMTDGGSDNAVVSLSRTLVDELTANGAIVRGFQIGRQTPSDTQKFNSVWNEGRPVKFGVAVGETIGNLVPAVAEALSEHLSDVSL